MNSAQNTTIRVDRYVLAEIRANRTTTDAVAEMAIALREIWSTEKLLGTLLDRIVERIPAVRGVVMIPGSVGHDLKSALFHGNPFNADRELCLRAYRDSTAELQDSSRLCAPLWMDGVNAGAVYIDSRTRSWTREHLHLFIALAAQAAWRLEYTRRLDGLQVQKKQMSEYLGVARGIVGKSPRLVDLRERIARIAGSQTTVLIIGEMGTGKELVARAIHDAGRGKENTDAPFMAINCAAIPDNLLESELFGYEKGAFTGAASTRIGKIEAADGGTVFLDEIGEMAPAMQAKLLRVLQEREFQRVGGIETVKVDIRVVAATNRNLKQAVAQGTFKQDLFDRLNVIPLQTPSLREIREDIPALVERFIEDLRYVNVVKGVSAEALDALTGYHWPGNTRQLRNVVEYALNFAEREGLIQPEHLPETVWEEPEGMSAASLDAKVDEARRAAIEKAVQESGGNMERTAAKLGITTRHLRRLRRLLAEG